MGESRKKMPARTPEEETNYMIRISVDAAEKQILNGRASSQLLTHYLKLAAVREREKLEQKKLEKEIALLQAKKEAIETAKETEAMYTAAIKAFGVYSGADSADEDIDEYYD